MFSSVLNQHAPIKTVTIRNPTAPPVSSETSDLMSRRRGALRVWGHGSSEYRRLNRAVRSAIRRDTRADVCRRIEEQGPNSVWRNTREIIGGRSSGRRTLPSVSADCMNEYFVQVGPRVAGEVADQGPILPRWGRGHVPTTSPLYVPTSPFRRTGAQ